MRKLLENKYFLISFIALVTIFITGISYAWYTYNLGDTNVAFEVDGIYVNYNGGNNISNTNLLPTSAKESGIVKDITVSVDKDVTPVPTFNLYLKVNTLETGLNHASFKWELYKNGTYLNDGTFESVSVGDTLTLTTNQTISTTEDKYTLYIWIDGNMENPDSMYSQDFAFELYANGENALVREGKTPDISQTVTNSLAYDLVSTYNNAEKTDVTNNGIVYHYYDGPNMMSDIAGNLRYYGNDPDNYIYFNCDDYSAQSKDTCEVWRIIGVFGDLVKIMRAESIGTMPWDTNAGIYYDYSYHYGSNQWGNYSGYTGASLMRLLNPGYESNSINNSLYYTGGSGSCYSNGQGVTTEECDYTTIGLKNDNTRNMVVSTTYYTAGYKTINIYANQIYTYERGSLVGDSTNDGVTRKTSWAGKVALPYPSDYGYAADLSVCTVNLETYNNANCTENNWMYALNGNGTMPMWLLNPRSGVQGNVLSVEDTGEIYLYYNCNSTLEVFPTLHISTSTVVDGTGDVNKPYQIQLS